METVLLGITGLQICPLVFGTLPLGPLQAALTPNEGGKLIRYALERGVTMLDTAELYGTYPHIRSALNGFRGEVRIASKTHAADRLTARKHIERALRELKREQLDVVHLHGARLANPFIERAQVVDELSLMKEEGKIKHIGLSSHYISAIRQAATQTVIDVIHPLFNVTGMGILDGPVSAMAEAIAACSRAGKGVYAMKALAGGNLITDARRSIRFVLHTAGIDALAIGMLSTSEVDANLTLLTKDNADESKWEVLERRQRKLRIMESFCKGCGGCLEACASGSLFLDGGVARVREDTCILCGYCAAACPEFIIRVV